MQADELVRRAENLLIDKVYRCGAGGADDANGWWFAQVLLFQKVERRTSILPLDFFV